MPDQVARNSELSALAKEYPSFPAWYQAFWLEDYWEATELPEPTQAMPGTEEKIAILQKRYESGQILFHPDDLFLCGDNS